MSLWFEAFAGLGGLGAARVAAEDFAEGGAVVAVSFGGGVEVEDDAEAAVAVEAVVVEEVARDRSAAGRHLAGVEASACLARQALGGLGGRVAEDEQRDGAQRRAREGFEQQVRAGEAGSSELIRTAAAKSGATVYEYELEAQFRCNGSDGFVNWIDNTLGIRRTANTLWDMNDPFEFRIVETVQELEHSIREKQREGFSARLAAGFCWPWSFPDNQGRLVNDVVVGEWSMPWNAKPDSRSLAKGIPKSHYWASDANGIEQVGCVYTAQGFEFDYVGVIFGLDLRYDPKSGTWVGDKTQSHDAVVKRSKDMFLSLVKNTYRVLLTRGMRGCYVYFMDEATRNFFRSRVE